MFFDFDKFVFEHTNHIPFIDGNAFDDENNSYIDSYDIFEAKSVTLKYIKQSLDENFCVFMYRKKNGEKRYAFGTRRWDFIKKRWKPSPNGTRKLSPFTIVYWDLAKKNFRQFRIGSFLKMVDKNPDIEKFANDHKEIYHRLRRYFPKKKNTPVSEKPVENETDNSIGKNVESIDEKMKIIPISNNELDCVKDKFYVKLKNPLFKDIKDGMTVVIENNGVKNMFIVMDYENLPEFFAYKYYSSYYKHGIFIKYDDGSSGHYSFWDRSQFKWRFPLQDKWDYVKIIDVYDTEINTKSINTIKDLKYEYENIQNTINV